MVKMPSTKFSFPDPIHVRFFVVIHVFNDFMIQIADIFRFIYQVKLKGIGKNNRI
jgi:hypothetical protein